MNISWVKEAAAWLDKNFGATSSIRTSHTLNGEQISQEEYDRDWKPVFDKMDVLFEDIDKAFAKRGLKR